MSSEIGVRMVQEFILQVFLENVWLTDHLITTTTQDNQLITTLPLVSN